MENKQQNIETMTSEDLALALGQQYQTLMQAQANIQIINLELEKRKKGKPDDGELQPAT